MANTLIITSNEDTHLIDIHVENHRREKTFIASFAQGTLQLLTLFVALENIWNIKMGYEVVEITLTKGDKERLWSALNKYSCDKAPITILRAAVLADEGTYTATEEA
jgi:hypothetical protein